MAATNLGSSVVQSSALISCNFSVITFNMHGFNQGSTFLLNLCESELYDVILIQEHWLSPALINKILNISDKYIGFGISAMGGAVSQDLLRGRPFGSTAILIKD